MNHLLTMTGREITDSLRSPALLVFGVLALAGGLALPLVSPGPDTLPVVILQVTMTFLPLVGLILGWSSGQRTIREAPFLLAQPLRVHQIILGKLLGQLVIGGALVVLFVLPPTLGYGLVGLGLQLTLLSVTYLVLFVVLGDLVGLMVRSQVNGLTVVLLIWSGLVVAWDLILVLLRSLPGIPISGNLLTGLMLINPVDTYRLTVLVGSRALPFSMEGELEVYAWLFELPHPAVWAVFGLWLLGSLLGSYFFLRNLEV